MCCEISRDASLPKPKKQKMMKKEKEKEEKTTVLDALWAEVTVTSKTFSAAAPGRAALK